MIHDPHALPDDVTCWNRFRQGDDLALGQLMKRHYAALYQYGWLGDPLVRRSLP